MSNNEGPSIQTCGKIYSVSVHRQIIPAHLLNLPPRSNVVYVLSWKYIWTSFTPLEFTCMKSWNNENKELFFLLEPSCIYWFNALGYITFSWWIIGNTDLVCQYCLINHRFVFEVIVSHKPKYQNLSKGCYFLKTINHYPLSVWWEISKWKWSCMACATLARSAKLLGWIRFSLTLNFESSEMNACSESRNKSILLYGVYFQTDIQTNWNRGVEV